MKISVEFTCHVKYHVKWVWSVKNHAKWLCCETANALRKVKKYKYNTKIWWSTLISENRYILIKYLHAYSNNDVYVRGQNQILHWIKELTLYLMIKTKSRSCKGVNSKKHPRTIRAGYDYNPALQNLRCLILGLTD